MTATTTSGCRLALETKFDSRVPQWLAFAVPTIAELSIRKRALMRLAQRHLTPDRLWVNPDCGLKTRNWAEVRLAIATMVSAARTLRADPSAGI